MAFTRYFLTLIYSQRLLCSFFYAHLFTLILFSPSLILPELTNSITTGMFGAILSYIMIIGSLCQNILLTYIDAQWCTSSAVWSILLVGIFVLPLSCIRDFGHLAYVSVWSIATIAATIFVVLIVGLLSFKKNEGEKLNLDLFQGSIRMLGTVVFAFSYSPAIFQAYSAIKKEERNIKNFNTIARWTTALGVILSFTFGLMGYISFREGDSNVLTGFLIFVPLMLSNFYLFDIAYDNHV